MLLKLTRPLVFFDLETTGLRTEADRVVEIGLVKLHPDGRRDALCERVDPGIDIPDGATKIHGIHTGDVRGLFGKPQLPKIADRILAFFEGADVSGFNSLSYDMPLWLAECERHGIPFSVEGRQHVDVKIIFHAKETGWDRFLMGPRNLTAAVRHYLGRDLDGAHAADADAGATVDVLLAQIERYDDLPRDVAGLAKWCLDAKRDQEAAQLQQQN